MSWLWIHKLGSPKFFYGFSKRFATPIFFSGLLFSLLALGWGLGFAPSDYQQGDSYRIMYIHVPAAMLAQSCYLAMGIAGLVFLVWQMKMAAIFIQAVAPIGAVMALLALVTGSIWGKPTWGTWWVWDARLTSVLLLWILYMGVIALQNSLEEKVLANKATAVLSLVGLINLPIIKYSVEWWNTLHQPASLSLIEKPTMPMEMWLPLVISILGMYLFVAGLTLWRMQTHVLLNEHKASWVKKEVLNNGI
ncbi:heme ABC transporter permease [Marinomonas sp.]